MTWKPDVVTEEMLDHLDYLNSAGRSGWGVTIDLERRFALTPQAAATVVRYWMELHPSRSPSKPPKPPEVSQ